MTKMEQVYQKVFTDEEEKTIHDDFPLLSCGSRTYLDNAGAALYSKSQLNAIHEDLSRNIFHNPHTNFGEAVGGRNDINSRVHEARQLVLKFFRTNSDKYKVIFTFNASASMKLVAENFTWNSGSTFAHLDECHTSAVGLRQYAQQNNAEIVVLSEDQFESQVVSSPGANNLVVFPAMSNFCGKKFPVDKWTSWAHDRNFHVLVDAAAYVSTNRLDLSSMSPDFVAISFYKIFGYPTGIGALLVLNSSVKLLHKSYFGGGTVEMNLVRKVKHVPKSTESYFEDGTIPFLSIAAIKFGFEAVNRYSIEKISEHTFRLAQYLYGRLKRMTHQNGIAVAKIYAGGNEPFTDASSQGGIVNFNLVRPDGSLFGFSEFQKICVQKSVTVRVGCFCNIGACQRYLELSDDDVDSNHAAGHVCGDDMDIINGKPTGSIRISFGYYSTKSDADQILQIVEKHFVDNVSSCHRNESLHATLSTTAFISALYLYPVKSCAPVRVDEWPLASGSLMFDRKFLIMHGGSALTQKSCHALCLVKPSIDLDRKLLRLSFENVDPLDVDIVDDDRLGGQLDSFSICIGKVCGDKVQAIDCGQRASDWLENVTGLTGLKLVQLIERKHEAKHQNGSASTKLDTFANEDQFLIINRASCDALEVENTDGDWLVEQFRGNLIVDGVPPFDEDTWKSLEVVDENESLKFNVSSLCTRCTIIGIDQKTGQRVTSQDDPISALTKRTGQRFKFGVLASLNSDSETRDRNLYVKMKVRIHRSSL